MGKLGSRQPFAAFRSSVRFESRMPKFTHRSRRWLRLNMWFDWWYKIKNQILNEITSNCYRKNNADFVSATYYFELNWVKSAPIRSNPNSRPAASPPPTPNPPPPTPPPPTPSPPTPPPPTPSPPTPIPPTPPPPTPSPPAPQRRRRRPHSYVLV